MHVVSTPTKHRVESMVEYSSVLGGQHVDVAKELVDRRLLPVLQARVNVIVACRMSMCGGCWPQGDLGLDVLALDVGHVALLEEGQAISDLFVVDVICQELFIRWGR